MVRKRLIKSVFGGPSETAFTFAARPNAHAGLLNLCLLGSHGHLNPFVYTLTEPVGLKDLGPTNVLQRLL